MEIENTFEFYDLSNPDKTEPDLVKGTKNNYNNHTEISKLSTRFGLFVIS